MAVQAPRHSALELVAGDRALLGFEKVAAGQAGQKRSRRDRAFVGWQHKPFGDNVVAVVLESRACLL